MKGRHKERLSRHLTQASWDLYASSGCFLDCDHPELSGGVQSHPDTLTEFSGHQRQSPSKENQTVCSEPEPPSSKDILEDTVPDLPVHSEHASQI